MAQWKRVYVPGKGYRWTDGKGNYKTNNPSFRNPANAAVNAGVSAARSTAKSAKNAATKSAAATARAASRTAENERNASSNAIGYAARKKAEKAANNPSNQTVERGGNTNTDPQSSNFYDGGTRANPNRLMKTRHRAYARTRQAQIDAERERLKGVGNPPAKPEAKPQPAAARSTASPTSRTAASRPSTPAAPKKPAAPASPKDRRVSAATANRESGNYGTSRTNNPMIDDAMKARMRQREERDGVGPVKDGARYAADVKSSTQGVGPVKDGERYASNLKPANKNTPAKKGMTLAERMRKRRQGLA